MEDRASPQPNRPVLVRASEFSRLEALLLAKAYEQVCPQVRRPLPEAGIKASGVGHNGRPSTAARVAAGAA